MSYEATKSRVETYFDSTATRTWERLTSDAPVSRIRETVRQGRDRMRALMLSRLPQDLHGSRVLDAGCGTGAMSVELARRGAEVVGVDISPQLIGIAEARLPEALRTHVQYEAGDMMADRGWFDHVVAMDSLIYYSAEDIAAATEHFAPRGGHMVFTVAPKTPLLTAMWYAGKLFPRGDRSPVMVPQVPGTLAKRIGGQSVGRVSRGFYISEALEVTR